MSEYIGFVDPSGGSSDSMTMAVAHVNFYGVAILDAVFEHTPPFSPDDVVRMFADTLREYRVGAVVGDRYAGEWPRERFREHGIGYIPSDRTKSEIFLEFLVLVNSGRARIPPNKRLRTQLISLERRTSRSGRDSVDHKPGGHDDVANAVAGALVLASASGASGGEPIFEVLDLDDVSEPPHGANAERNWTKIF